MNDPHVESLEYRLVTDPTHVYHNPQAVEQETQDFSLRLMNGVLTVTMKQHYAYEGEARASVTPLIRAWEIDAALRRGRREMWFEFQRATVIDRAPSPPGQGLGLAVTGVDAIITSGHVSLCFTSHHYPEPPTDFSVSPDVEMLWNRYEHT